MNRTEANIVELDVREQLRNKLEPFQLIMDTVKKLGPDDIFVLHATIKPTPLHGLLKMRGFAGKSVKQKDPDHWISTFVNKKNKHWLDESALSEEDTDSKIKPVTQPETQINTPVTQPSSPEIPNVTELDNRGLEPPKPMVRTLAALERCRPGDEVHIHNDRFPMFLIEELNTLGCTYTIEEQQDGSAKVRIIKA